jgi:hypothetical protein
MLLVSVAKTKIDTDASLWSLGLVKNVSLHHLAETALQVCT